VTEPPAPGFAVSPGTGIVPAIYVPRPPEQATAPWHDVAAAVARQVSGWYHRVSMGGTMSGTPADRRYSQDHLWARPATPGLVRVGVTDFAQQSLGDVIDVTLPRPGDQVDAGTACGDIESTKSVSDLTSPVTGTVRARNDDLAGAPELVNTDPYGQGWLVEIEADPAALDDRLANLMDASAYDELTGT
jgi:glycine cleavage system H protein